MVNKGYMASSSGAERFNSKNKPVKRRTEVDEGSETNTRPGMDRKADPTRWRMRDDHGRHSWHYLEDENLVKEWPQTHADKYFLALPLDLPQLPKPKTPLDFVRNGLTFFEKLQLPAGHWGCEYGGPMFLLPGVVFTWHITKTTIPWYKAAAIRDYLFARAHPKDGGWGLHIEGETSVLGTIMNYTALRLVGVEADHPKLAKARATLHKMGGATHAAHWAKFWMAVLGIAKWDLVNPVPPELWLLPDWMPIAPWRWWVHIRMVYLPMGYLWSQRYQTEETNVIRELRNELFVEEWDQVDWAGNRNTIAVQDNYHPKSTLMNTINWFLVNLWGPLRPKAVAKLAEVRASELIDMEDENTDYADLATVNGPMNTIVCYVRDGPGSYSVKRHLERMEEGLWVNQEGLFCNGTNGVQCWDTAFAIQAVMDAGLAEDPRWRPMLLKALSFLDDQQIRENPKHYKTAYRQQRKGGWAFSNKDQGYAVSDCVSEALKAVIMLQKTQGFPTMIDDERIFDAIDTLLTYQNPSGACSSYEPPRAGTWMEMLNVAEVFGNIMVEYEYPECTTAVVTALSLFNKHWPDYRTNEIKSAVSRAVHWIKTVQKPHGGWYGSWGICFTYATMFALESLHSIGETYQNSICAKKGCEFLISKQRDDGGWSESYKACETGEYFEHPSGSQVVMTSWALIGLMNAKYPHAAPLRKGVKLIMERQQGNGEWLQEAVEGIFNKSCIIAYPNYKFQFPIKALGMFAQRYPNISWGEG